MIAETASLWAMARKYEDVLRRDPAAYSFAPLADIYRSLGLVEDAVNTARKGVRLHPDFAAGQFVLAKAALESSLIEEARSALEAVVRITPENLEAQRLLADLYTAAGDDAAALRCLAIVSALDVDAQSAASVPAPEVEELVEEIAETDILELTDDLIEEPDSADLSAAFTTVPDRPSLGESQSRPVPFMIEETPPLPSKQDEDHVPEEPPAEELPPAAAPVSSATIAELYISQGFVEKGADIYRELLQTEPDNQGFIKRLAEIAPTEVIAPVAVEPAPPAAAALTAKEELQEPAPSFMESLNGWLGNVRRVKECRTKSL